MTTTIHSAGAHTPGLDRSAAGYFALVGRLFLAYMFIPAGFGKIAGICRHRGLCRLGRHAPAGSRRGDRPR